MNIEETKQLLRLIESYDRAPFRPEAVDLWFEALRRVSYGDAEAAVHQIFRMAGHDEKGGIRRLLPADVRRPADAIADSRHRKTAQKAIRAAARPPANRSAEAERMIALARARADAAVARYREKIAA